MKKIVLVGGGGHCRSCIDVIEQLDEFEIVGIVDKTLALDYSVMGYPVIGDDHALDKLINQVPYAFITIGQIGDGRKRQIIYDRLLAIGYKLPIIVSPFAHVARDVLIGFGSIVMHGSIINSCAKIGQNCILNTRSLVEHDVIVEDFCHVSTAATINGGSTVGEYSFIGSNAVVIDSVSVPVSSFIKANQTYKGQR